MIDGVWGEDGGPGYEQKIESLSNRRLEAVAAAEDARKITWEREGILTRHKANGACGPLDEGMHWAQMQKLAEEQDWALANYILALKLGYGKYDDGDSMFEEVDGVEVVLENLGGSESPDLQKSFALLRHSVEQNRTWAQYLSNNLGDGKSLDLQKSFALLRRSAEQGHTWAQYLLAEAYLTGEWGKNGALQVEVNREEWMSKAVASYE